MGVGKGKGGGGRWMRVGAVEVFRIRGTKLDDCVVFGVLQPIVSN